MLKLRQMSIVILQLYCKIMCVCVCVYTIINILAVY